MKVHVGAWSAIQMFPLNAHPFWDNPLLYSLFSHRWHCCLLLHIFASTHGINITYCMHSIRVSHNNRNFFCEIYANMQFIQFLTFMYTCTLQLANIDIPRRCIDKFGYQMPLASKNLQGWGASWQGDHLSVAFEDGRNHLGGRSPISGHLSIIIREPVKVFIRVSIAD